MYGHGIVSINEDKTVITRQYDEPKIYRNLMVHWFHESAIDKKWFPILKHINHK